MAEFEVVEDGRGGILVVRTGHSPWLGRSREELIEGLGQMAEAFHRVSFELTGLRELVDYIAEAYPGESPTDGQIRNWIAEIKEKAWQYDELCH